MPEFASLTRDQLDYIHDLLRHKTYDEAQQEIWSSLGCLISTNRLQRYREKIDLAAALEIADQDTIPAVDQLNNLLAGRETNIPAAGIHLIQQRALALAASIKTSPTLLKDLFRIFIYEDRRNERRAMNEHRKATDLRRLEIAEQREQTRTRLADLAERKHDDAQKLATERNPKPINQEQMTADIDMACGRAHLRQEAASSSSGTGASPSDSTTRSCSADNPACDSQPKPQTRSSNVAHQRTP